MYWRNPTNIGGDPNILKVRSRARGQYVWVLGDDELLAQDALAKLLALLRNVPVGLVIAFNPNYECPIPAPEVFADYRAFALACQRVNPHALAQHTLISCNIHRADCYDFEYSRCCLDQTSYSHMFAMLRPLLSLRAPVALPDFAIINLRDARAPAGGGRWVCDLDAQWVRYFEWLRDEMQLKDFDPHAPSEYARRALIRRLLRHPVRTVCRNRGALFQPYAWRFAFNRLLRRRG